MRRLLLVGLVALLLSSAAQAAAPTIKPTKTLEPNGTGVECLAFSPDGKILACGSADGTASLWNVATGELIRHFKACRQYLMGISFSSDSKRLLTAESGAQAHMWDVGTGKMLTTFHARGGIHAAVFLADDKTVATGDTFMVVHTFDAASGKMLQTMEGHQHVITNLCVTADKDRLISGALDNTVRVWDPSSGKQLLEINVPDMFRALAISPDGSKIYTAEWKQNPIVWDGSTGQQIKTLDDKRLQGINSMGISSDGKYLAFGTFIKQIFLIDADSGARLAVMRDHRENIQAIAFSPDGHYIASGGGGKLSQDDTWTPATDDGVRLWDIRSVIGGGSTTQPTTAISH